MTCDHTNPIKSRAKLNFRVVRDVRPFAVLFGSYAAAAVPTRWILRVTVALFAIGILPAGGQKGWAQGDAVLLNTSGNRAGKSEIRDEYRLGPLDKVRLKVFEWRASRDEVFEWKAMNDEYIIGPAGKISLPLVGEVPAAGSTTAELSTAIGARLRNRIGLAESPDISVEILQFRPFYIVGYVDKAGEYAYRPELTVLKAVSLAGGQPRRDPAGLRLEREAISGTGDVALMTAELQALIAHRARLEAEMSRAATLEFPSSLDARHQRVAGIIQQERALFQANRKTFDAQLTSLQSIKAFLENESKLLQSQLEVHTNEAKLVKQELADVTSLAGQRLTTQSRKLNVQRNVYQLDGDRLRIELGLVKIRQDVSKNELAIAEFMSSRHNELTKELRTAQLRYEELTRKLATARDLLADTTGDQAEIDAEKPRFVTSYAIVRNGQEFETTEFASVLPGDTIKIERRRVPLSKGPVTVAGAQQ